MGRKEVMNVLDPQYSRYFNVREELEEYLDLQYGINTNFNMTLTDFKIFHENDRWSFMAPEKLSKKQVKEMSKWIMDKKIKAAKAEGESDERPGGSDSKTES